MSDKSGSPSLPPLTLAQIITGAMIFGVITFAVVALMVGGVVADDPADQPIGMLRLIYLPLAIVTLVAAWLIPSKAAHFFARGHGPADWRGIENRFLTMVIVVGALLEAPAIFAAIILLLSQDPADLLLVVIPLAGFALIFPTRPRLDRFVRLAGGENESSPFNEQDRENRGRA